MKISEHVYRVHINEDDSPFGTYHPGGSSIYFIGNPNTNMVVMDTGEHYRSWTDQIDHTETRQTPTTNVSQMLDRTLSLASEKLINFNLKFGLEI